jgi:uncharacterized protein
MRLHEIEKNALKHALSGVDGTAFLFGSRTDDERKGGDIDVLVYSKTASPYRLSQEIAVRFRMECDEKIDVLVVDPDHIAEEQKPFLNLIQKQAVPLL